MDVEPHAYYRYTTGNPLGGNERTNTIPLHLLLLTGLGHRESERGGKDQGFAVKVSETP